MKPTIDSIAEASRASEKIAIRAMNAGTFLAMARTALECSSPERAKKILKATRAQLVRVRRTQTAALGHIADAIKSLVETK